MNNPFQKIYKNIEFRNVLRYRKNPSLFPFIVDIELTNHCNLKCLFCGQQNMKREKGFISEKIFKKVVDECAKHNTPIRLIRWGEPFLHPKILKFIEYIKNKNLPLHITTNGLSFKEGDIEAIVRLGLDSLIISLQGANKCEYERMRNNSRYNELVKNIKKIAKIKGKLYLHITSTMTNETKKQINIFIKKWSKIVDAVNVGKTNLSRVSVEPKIKKKETIKHEYCPCTEIYQKLSVDWDGKVSCCCSDWDRFMTVGDVNKQTLKDIWNKSNQLKVFRKMLDNMEHGKLPMCRNCFHPYHSF